MARLLPNRMSNIFQSLAYAKTNVRHFFGRAGFEISCGSIMQKDVFKCSLENSSYRHLQFVCRSDYVPVRVPIVYEETGRDLRAHDIYSRLLGERIICLFGPVTTELCSSIVSQLLFLQSESTKKPVHMYINSPGGSVTAGLGIYDTMQHILPPVSTWCIGQAASMGSLLLSAGTKGMRHSLPHSRVMIHQPSGQAAGQATDIQIQAEEILKLKQQIIEIYMLHTGKSSETISNFLERDRFMSPEEAKDFGLIDEVHYPAEKTAPKSN